VVARPVRHVVRLRERRHGDERDAVVPKRPCAAVTIRLTAVPSIPRRRSPISRPYIPRSFC
jgi:hypothetical protein